MLLGNVIASFHGGAVLLGECHCRWSNCVFGELNCR